MDATNDTTISQAARGSGDLARAAHLNHGPAGTDLPGTDRDFDHRDFDHRAFREALGSFATGVTVVTMTAQRGAGAPAVDTSGGGTPMENMSLSTSGSARDCTARLFGLWQRVQ